MTADSEGLHEIANTTNQDRKADIVFVHGLGGISHGTWRYTKEGQDGHFFWPEELGKDLPDCGIWTVGYPAGFTALGKPGMIIEKRAGNLSQKLANAGLGVRPLLFITHSMAGLIVKSLIVGSQTLADPDRKRIVTMVRGIVFCATPHRGSAFADAAGVLSKFFGGSQAHVDEMRANAEPLDILHDQFIEWHRNHPIPVESYAENVGLFRTRWLLRPLPLGLVVPRASANPGIAGHTVRDVDDDHLTLVKPPNRKHDVYAGVLRFIGHALTKVSSERVNVTPAARPPLVAATQSAVETITAVGRPRVYLSYTLRTQGLRERVFELAEKLRENGIDSRMDLYYAKSLHGFTPPDPIPDRDSWEAWQEAEIRDADCVLVLCSREYIESPNDSGAWRDMNFMKKNLESGGAALRKLIPVGFGAYEVNSQFIPSFIRGATYYDLTPGTSTGFGFEDLLRRFRTEFPPESGAVQELSSGVKSNPSRELNQRVQSGRSGQAMSEITVFISYSHDSDEHRERVLALSERLRQDGIETLLDQYVNGSPQQGWPRWMLDQLDTADSVLVVCTETYYRRFRGHEEPGKGKGGDWEGALITQGMYDRRSRTLKFVPVFLSAAVEDWIPEPLRSVSYYALTSENAYHSLYDFLLEQAGVEAGPLGALKTKPRRKGNALTFGEPPPSTVATRDISRIIKYAPAQLIGREAETKLLSDAWEKAVRGETKRPHVLTFVALGGEGKTSLVAKWAADLAHQGWPGCDAVFAWSFYSQGTREETAASSDLFLKEALTAFGDPAMAGSAQGAFDKGRRLAELVGERRALLILDGVEPLQYPPMPPMDGKLKDDGIAELLKGLAANNHGLCVVTTRYSIPDLRAYWQTTAPETKLLRLSKAAGVALLRSLGVRGTPKEFETLVEDVHGHALTVNLLGSYLHDAHAGDIRKRDLVKLEEAAEEQGGHAFRVMDAYARWFESEGEKGKRALAVLRLLGLFDRPATADCLAALLKAPAIPGLTEALVGMSQTQRNLVFTRLAAAKLLTVNRDAAGSLLALDAHPLLREYFARQLRTQQSEAWRTAHRRLYEHLCATTPDKPQPELEDLQPLYQAVAHGCQAGMQQEACDKVYVARIARGQEAYAVKKLGAFGSDLGAVACFFDPPWSRLSPSLTETWQAWLLNEAAFRLRALGRLTEALEPMRAGLENYVKQENWQAAAISASNLSELELTLGEVAAAVGDAEQSATYADRSGDAFQRISRRTTHANALHQAGRRAEAEARFCGAEALQAESQPDYPLLYSMRGFKYCDLLLAASERAAWQCMLGAVAVQPAVSGILPEKPQRAVTQKTLSSHENATSSIAQEARRSRQDARAPQIQSCRCVSQRAAKMFEWRVPGDSLLDIALDHLTLGRAALYEAILEGSSPEPCRSSLQHAVDGLRRAGRSDYLPHGLLTRAWLRSLSGARTGPESAQADLDEAWEIAERGPMPLFLADIHLHRARLFGGLKSEASGEQYPWESPAADLAAARRLIEKHGYLRRIEELEDAEAAASNLPGSTE